MWVTNKLTAGEVEFGVRLVSFELGRVRIKLELILLLIFDLFRILEMLLDLADPLNIRRPLVINLALRGFEDVVGETRYPLILHQYGCNAFI